MTTNIILVGFMGTGKSVVGKRLAASLRRSFVDTDELIAAAAARSVPEIFATIGEAGFRDQETGVLRDLAGVADTVIAAGGGVLGRDENVVLLRGLGPLVCLTARPAVILERTYPWHSRPLLAGTSDPTAVVEGLLRERAARYALADVTVDTSDLSPDEVVAAICRALA